MREKGFTGGWAHEDVPQELGVFHCGEGFGKDGEGGVAEVGTEVKAQ